MTHPRAATAATPVFPPAHVCSDRCQHPGAARLVLAGRWRPRAADPARLELRARRTLACTALGDALALARASGARSARVVVM